jgi:hypothetical protein
MLEQWNKATGRSTKRGITNAIRSCIVGVQWKTHWAQRCNLLRQLGRHIQQEKMKLPLNLITHHATRIWVYGGIELKLHTLLNSALYRGYGFNALVPKLYHQGYL